MKNDTVEIVAKIEIPIQTLKYLYDLCNKSESTECDDSVVSIKPNNITIITETVSDNRKLQSNTTDEPSYKYNMYDTNPELFLDLYNRYMNGELSGPEIADLLGCTHANFANMVAYYRKKENIHEAKDNTRRSTRLAKYKIYDRNPELFLEVYNKYMNYELSAREAAKILDCSISTFNNMLKYYRDKENLHEEKYHINNKNLAKYDIYDKKPEEFLEVYNKFMNKEIYSREAARLLGVSVSTFYRSIKYYESKTGIEIFG